MYLKHNGIKITSRGAMNYNDYPTNIAKCGIDYANEHRQIYKLRHNNDRKTRNRQ